MTPEQITAIVGFVVALLLEYLPWFSTWYNKLEDNFQRLFALGAGFVVVTAAFGLGCAGLLGPYWVCDGPGGWDAFLAFLAYLVANQATYLVLPKRGS